MHSPTVATYPSRGKDDSKIGDKSVLTKIDLKQDKLARQSAVIGRLFQTMTDLWLKYHFLTRAISLCYSSTNL
jgi:hypothetical protein